MQGAQVCFPGQGTRYHVPQLRPSMTNRYFLKIDFHGIKMALFVTAFTRKLTTCLIKTPFKLRRVLGNPQSTALYKYKFSLGHLNHSLCYLIPKLSIIDPSHCCELQFHIISCRLNKSICLNLKNFKLYISKMELFLFSTLKCLIFLYPVTQLKLPPSMRSLGRNLGIILGSSFLFHPPVSYPIFVIHPPSLLIHPPILSFSDPFNTDYIKKSLRYFHLVTFQYINKGKKPNQL